MVSSRSSRLQALALIIAIAFIVSTFFCIHKRVSAENGIVLSGDFGANSSASHLSNRAESPSAPLDAQTASLLASPEPQLIEIKSSTTQSAPTLNPSPAPSISASVYAITTLVSSTDYVSGANVLLYSIRKFIDPLVLHKVKFVALLIEGKIENPLIESGLHVGWARNYVPLIRPARPGDVTFKRFAEKFTKLALWKMIEFKRILYMDSDTMAVGDVSPILIDVNSTFAAVLDWELGKIVSHFNMGVASLVPNMTEFNRLDSQRLTKRDYRLSMAEQGLLNAVYGTNYQIFPFAYNGNLAAAVQDRSFWDSHRKQLRIIHFTWIKPFHITRTAKLELQNCNGDCVKCADVLKEWWTMYDEMMAESESQNATESGHPVAPVERIGFHSYEINKSTEMPAVAKPFTPSASTVVTAYFRVPSKHANDKYDTWMANMLSLQDSMVIFTSPDFVNNIRRHREFAENRTYIVTMELTKVPVAVKYALSLWERMLDKDYEKSIHRSYMLFWIWLSKPWFVLKSIDLNPFSSENFIWVDIGSFRDTTYNKDTLVRYPEIIPQYSILVQTWQSPNFVDNPVVIKNYDTLNSRSFFVAGALMAGKMKTWIRFYKAYDLTLQKYFNEDLFVGEDQAIIQSTCFRFVKLCAFIAHDQTPQNAFFSLQYVLHTKGNSTKLLWYNISNASDIV